MTAKIQFIRFAPAIAVAALMTACGSSGSPDAAKSPSSANTSAASAPHPEMTPLDADLNDPQSLEKALEKNPGHTPIRMRLAELALRSGDAAKASEHLRAVIAQEPGNTEARLELGRALWDSGDRKGAETETAAILEIDPNNVDALYNLGAIQANQQQKEQAISYWTRAVTADPTSPSGQNAQRGLDTLAGRPVSIPDIPEHRNVRQGETSGGPTHPSAKSGHGTRGAAGSFERIIDFAKSK